MGLFEPFATAPTDASVTPCAGLFAAVSAGGHPHKLSALWLAGVAGYCRAQAAAAQGPDDQRRPSAPLHACAGSRGLCHGLSEVLLLKSHQGTQGRLGLEIHMLFLQKLWSGPLCLGWPGYERRPCHGRFAVSASSAKWACAPTQGASCWLLHVAPEPCDLLCYQLGTLGVSQ